jgi:hypothetical protein
VDIDLFKLREMTNLSKSRHSRIPGHCEATPAYEGSPRGVLKGHKRISLAGEGYDVRSPDQPRTL